MFLIESSSRDISEDVFAVSAKFAIGHMEFIRVTITVKIDTREIDTIAFGRPLTFPQIESAVEAIRREYDVR